MSKTDKLCRRAANGDIIHFSDSFRERFLNSIDSRGVTMKNDSSNNNTTNPTVNPVVANSVTSVFGGGGDYRNINRTGAGGKLCVCVRMSLKLESECGNGNGNRIWNWLVL